MAVVDETRYKSNSYKSKAEAEKREVQKVVKGQTRVHQKTTAEKLKESWRGEFDIERLFTDVFIPSLKELFDICLTNAKDMALYGEVRDPAGRGRTGRTGAYVSYDGYGRKSRRDTASARRARFDFSYIEFESPDDIDDVIEEMRDIFTVYNEITVAQYYQSADPDGIRISPTDNNWGWIDIRAFTMADIRKVRSRNPDTGEVEVRWVLDLPRPKPLD